ncbi:hypothetical protein [Rhodococcus koreensis]
MSSASVAEELRRSLSDTGVTLGCIHGRQGRSMKLDSLDDDAVRELICLVHEAAEIAAEYKGGESAPAHR